MSGCNFQREEIAVSFEDVPISLSSSFRLILALEIVQLRSYANTVEKMLVEHMQKIDDEFQEHKTRRAEEEREALLNWYGGEVVSLTYEFPKILRYSLFVHSYGLVERVLLQVASHYRQTRHLELSPSDLRDNGIKRVRTYLKKVALVPFPDIEPWQDITTLNLIRNLIVHNEGTLHKSQGEERQKIECLAKKMEWKCFYRRYEY